jgi:5-methylcytosine-specific restriction endonuclease McrA
MSKSRHHRILNLWRQNPRCYWCNRLTVLIFRPPGMLRTQCRFRGDEATIDHLVTRYDGRQQTHGQEMTVMACRDCNGRRGASREAQVPLEELRRRSRREGTG